MTGRDAGSGPAAPLPGRPLVSVGMSVRNNAATVELAVRSVLAQTWDELELIVIDDGSTDDTAARLRAIDDPRLRVVDGGPGRGLPARLNQAVGLARGELFARMDGDDVSYPDRLARQVARLREADAPDLVGAGVAVFRDDLSLVGVRRSPPGHEAITARPADGFGMAHPTWVGRTDWFRRWGYRVGAVGMEDQDLLLRAHRHSRYANVPELLLGYRESRLDLRKIARARRHVATGFAAEHLRQRRPGLALRSVAGQAARMGVDLAAVGLRLDYRLLAHRARPATPEEAARWREVLLGLGVDPPPDPVPDPADGPTAADPAASPS